MLKFSSSIILLTLILSSADSLADVTEVKLAAIENHKEEAAEVKKDKDLDEPKNSKEKPDYQCNQAPASDEMVDRIRASAYVRLCNTAGWLDGLFGDEEQYPGDKFRGKISLGFEEDEVEGLDPRVRVRIKTKLPNMSKRFDAFLGRVEEDSYISNTEVNEDRVNNVGLRSTNDQDSEWLVGLGYKRPGNDHNGWDYSVGTKISSGLKPYAKATHRSIYETSLDTYWKATQTLFWRQQDGFGVSSNTEYTRLIGDNDIWVTHASLKYTDEGGQVEWFADTRWHHSFSKTRGISSSFYVRGEAENEVSIPEYGLTFTYIKPVWRDWLYLETGLDWRWEKQTKAETSYKSAVRFGIQLEMLLGDYYKRDRFKR
ncbi:MAG: hypothetical protein MK188_10065 [Gammaproteobacteria bacterium]|nr:hypothetical protein [Gammaproteobacteria bacterium]